MNTTLISKHNRPYTVSVIMIVKNEAENLKISLPAVADWVDEIIILDSGSSDESENIAKQHGAKWFVNTDWPGFGKQKQLAQSYASGDWILALDADEEVSVELKSSILDTITNEPRNDVYGIRRIDYIFDHPIDSPKWIIPIKAHWRLYPKKFTYNDNMVHESVDISTVDNTPALSGYLHHHTAPSPRFLLQKRLDYAHAWALERHEKNKKTSIPSIITHSVWAFFKAFILEGRFLVGTYGFIYAKFFAQYTFNKYAILYELNKSQQKNKTDD